MPLNLPMSYEAEDQIISAVVEVLRSRRGEDQPLEEIEDERDINRSDVSTTRRGGKAIWAGDGQTLVEDESTLRYSETRSLEIVLQSDIREKEAEFGPREARRLVLEAGAQLTLDENGEEYLRLGLDSFVQDVRFVRSMRMAADIAAGNYSHVAVYRVRYRARR